MALDFFGRFLVMASSWVFGLVWFELWF